MYTPTEKSGAVTVTTASQPKNQQRTAIVYFGSKRENYLELVEAEDSSQLVAGFLKSETEILTNKVQWSIQRGNKIRFELIP